MSYIANRAIHEQEWGATNFTRVLRLLLLFVSRKEGEKSSFIERIALGAPRTTKQEYNNYANNKGRTQGGLYRVVFHFTPSQH